MGWISAEGVAAVVQGAVRIPFKILFEFKNIQIPLFSGEASGSVCGLGGVKRKRADSGNMMEVDHNHHPGPQRPSKK